MLLCPQVGEIQKAILLCSLLDDVQITVHYIHQEQSSGVMVIFSLYLLS